MSYYAFNNEGVAGAFVSGGAPFSNPNLPSAGQTGTFIIINDSDSTARTRITRNYTSVSNPGSFEFNEAVPAKSYTFFTMTIPADATAVDSGATVVMNTSHGTSAQGLERVYIFRSVNNA